MLPNSDSVPTVLEARAVGVADKFEAAAGLRRRLSWLAFEAGEDFPGPRFRRILGRWDISIQPSHNNFGMKEIWSWAVLLDDLLDATAIAPKLSSLTLHWFTKIAYHNNMTLF